MPKHLLSLLLLSFFIMSCNNNFEKISKDPSQIAPLKKEVDKADLLKAWHLESYHVVEQEESYFDNKSDYQKYLDFKKHLMQTDLTTKTFGFHLFADGTLKSSGDHNIKRDGTYSLSNNQLILQEGRKSPETFEIVYLKKEDLILRMVRPVGRKNESSKMIIHFIMKQQEQL